MPFKLVHITIVIPFSLVMFPKLFVKFVYFKPSKLAIPSKHSNEVNYFKPFIMVPL